MDWNGKVVAVTGAGGFIGSHLTERLLGRGARVRAAGHGEKLGHLAGLMPAEGLEVFGGDLRDEAFAAEVISGAEVVFHLGAVTSVAYSYEHGAETIETNTMGTYQVMAAARACGAARVVHTSTAGAYGNAEGGAPIVESHPLRGYNPYSAGKLGGDHVAETFYLSYDLPVTTVRLFNIYGPRMGAYLIMPAIIRQLLEGPDLRLGDLRPTRSFTYVDDVAEAFLKMAESEAVVGEVVHFGTDKEITMGALAERIARLMDRPYSITQDPARMRPGKSEIYRNRADCGKAERVLGWTPKVGLDEGLERTIAWMTAVHGDAVKGIPPAP